MVEFHALRANHHFYACVSETLEKMQDSEWISKLDLCPASGGDACQPADSATMKAEASLLKVLFDFNVHLASNRCWSQSFYTLMLPYAFAGVYHPHVHRRGEAMRRLSEMAKALLDLEDYCARQKDAYAAKLLASLSTNKWQLTREMMLDWNAEALSRSRVRAEGASA